MRNGYEDTVWCPRHCFTIVLGRFWPKTYICEIRLWWRGTWRVLCGKIVLKENVFSKYLQISHSFAIFNNRYENSCKTRVSSLVVSLVVLYSVDIHYIYIYIYTHTHTQHTNIQYMHCTRHTFCKLLEFPFKISFLSASI